MQSTYQIRLKTHMSSIKHHHTRVVQYVLMYIYVRPRPMGLGLSSLVSHDSVLAMSVIFFVTVTVRGDAFISFRNCEFHLILFPTSGESLSLHVHRSAHSSRLTH